jgi:small subunit ribosomal protein S16
MVIIRLSRGGANKQPFYRVVVTDSRSARDGRYLEQVGYFNPVAKGKAVKLKLEQDRIAYWVSVGAQLSKRVGELLKRASATAAAA